MKNLQMKKVVLLAVAMVLAAAPVALATSYTATIPDNTDVQVYKGGSFTTWNGYGWYDVIGTVGSKTADGFNTSQIKVNLSNPGASGYQNLQLQIYTNFYPAFEYNTQPADIVLSLGGGLNNYGIAMSSHNGFIAGNLYATNDYGTANTNWLTSTQAQSWGNGSWWYGGAYADAVNTYALPGGNNDDHGNLVNPALTYLTGTPVAVSGVSETSPLTQIPGVGTVVNWAFNPDTDSDSSKYLVTVNLTGFTGALSGDLTTLSLFWGTGTCSNDGIQGTDAGGNVVPLPPSALLLGSGLLGLALLGKRQIRKSE